MDKLVTGQPATAAEAAPNAFEQRLAVVYDELKWLYHEIYRNKGDAFDYFVGMMRRCWEGRKAALREQDERRLAEPGWYRSNKLMGMMMYTSNYGGTLNGVGEKLDYLEECGVNYLHLMPLLDSPEGKSDGGYAVSDFRKVRPDLGTMEDLEKLADNCREHGIALCLDFVLNHTSEEHEWAKAARAGDPVARSRYFFYNDWVIPNEFEKTVPQGFPTTAPGSFTWLEDCQQIVMTSFYPFQWDLDYANPLVFNDMTENLLYLANRGMDVIRLDAVPYIWKELGTNCRNLPQVHTLVRMMHLACQIVCPSVLLLGEVVMEPAKVAPYFGTVEKPECDMLYNVTTMCTTWHTVATRSTALLRHQMDQVCALPKTCLFQNYLRCHDDIGWGLDYPWLRERFGQDEVAHKKYLNDWFTGKWPGSWSRGELYNDDPRLGDARLCGTTASLVGIEAAEYEHDQHKLELATDFDLMLHAFLLGQTGLPILYAGDEIGQLNDYGYHNDPLKWDDSRYLHRGNFKWDEVELRHDVHTRQGKIYQGLLKLENIRKSNPIFGPESDMWTFWAGHESLLGLKRKLGEQILTAVYNFSESPQHVSLEAYGPHIDLLTGEKLDIVGDWELAPYGFLWILYDPQ